MTDSLLSFNNEKIDQEIWNPWPNFELLSGWDQVIPEDFMCKR
jgi:hypothetical protein